MSWLLSKLAWLLLYSLFPWPIVSPSKYYGAILLARCILFCAGRPGLEKGFGFGKFCTATNPPTSPALLTSLPSPLTPLLALQQEATNLWPFFAVTAVPKCTFCWLQIPIGLGHSILWVGIQCTEAFAVKIVNLSELFSRVPFIENPQPC